MLVSILTGEVFPPPALLEPPGPAAPAPPPTQFPNKQPPKPAPPPRPRRPPPLVPDPPVPCCEKGQVEKSKEQRGSRSVSVLPGLHSQSSVLTGLELTSGAAETAPTRARTATRENFMLSVLGVGFFRGGALEWVGVRGEETKVEDNPD